jgi:hypothetical protein
MRARYIQRVADTVISTYQPKDDNGPCAAFSLGIFFGSNTMCKQFFLSFDSLTDHSLEKLR